MSVHHTPAPAGVWYTKGMSKKGNTLKKNKTKNYFFWNDRPYRVIKEYRRKNLVEALDLKENRRVMFPWNDWKRHRRKAFTTGQVAQILGRSHIRVRLWLSDGFIPRPYEINPDAKYGETQVNMLWSEDDIYRARDYMESTGRGDVPSRAEVQALINDDKLVQYIKDEETGEFIPVWVAQ